MEAKKFTYCGIARLGFSRFYNGGKKDMPELNRWRTRRQPLVLTGEYTTDNLTFEKTDKKTYPMGLVLYMKDDTKKLAIFNTDAPEKANYDLYILADDVVADKEKKVCVIASGKVNELALVVNDGSTGVRDTVVNGCTVLGWLGEKFTLNTFNTVDNYIPDNV